MYLRRMRGSMETGNKTEGTNTEVMVLVGPSVTFAGARNEETRSSQNGSFNGNVTFKYVGHLTNGVQPRSETMSNVVITQSVFYPWKYIIKTAYKQVMWCYLAQKSHSMYIGNLKTKQNKTIYSREENSREEWFAKHKHYITYPLYLYLNFCSIFNVHLNKLKQVVMTSTVQLFIFLKN